MRGLLYLGLVGLVVLHNDFWWWDDGGRVFGLPVGLTYHVAYCLVVAVWMGLLVRSLLPRAGASTGAGEASAPGEERDPA